MDFDFQAYVQRRAAHSAGKGAGSRGALSYSFTRDRALQRTLRRTRFVGHALRATARLGESHEAILDGSTPITESSHPTVIAAATMAASRLETVRPELRVTRELAGRPSAVIDLDGTPTVVFAEPTLELLAEEGLVFAVGTHLGQIECGHVPYLTTRHALEHVAEAFYGVIAKPAQIALEAWAKLGVISSDRAGLLACRDLDVARVSLVALTSLAAGLTDRLDPSHYLAELGREPREPSELDAYAPTLAVRLEALSLFAESAVYAHAMGRSDGRPIAAVDTDVEAIVKIW